MAKRLSFCPTSEEKQALEGLSYWVEEVDWLKRNNYPQAEIQ